MKDSAIVLAPRSYQRLTLIGLFAIFFIPILVAWWMTVHPGHWRPNATVNNGTLVEPTRSVFAAGLTHLDGRTYGADFFRQGWTLVLIGSTPCRDRCEMRLAKMRQARLALGKDMDRVRRLYAALKMSEPARVAELQRAHPGLNMARANPQWLTPFKLDTGGPDETSGIYLVDPEGRLMMHYAEEVAAEGILRDLQRLLKISKIG